jgi:hypothetical protein
MKKFLIALNLVIWSVVCFQVAYAAGESEKVCIKDAKGKETCKTIKVHKKLDGTKVPEKK